MLPDIASGPELQYTPITPKRTPIPTAAAWPRKRTKTLTLTSLLLFVVGAASAQDPHAVLKQYESFDFQHRLLAKPDFQKIHEEDDRYHTGDTIGSLELLRGVIFGKHGRIFKETGIQDFLKTRPWYRPNPSFSNNSLNDTERRNIDLIRGAEAKEHGRVMPGDLRFWKDRKIDSKIEDWDYSIAEIRIMRAEIEAIHGKTFPNEPLLQKYFEERYWYRADRNYKFSSLSPIERANLQALSKLEQKKRGTTFLPEDVILYSDKPIPEKLLQPLSLYELRLSRNALYALRGRRFRTPWLKDYFGSVEWYTPLPEGQTEKLTSNDEKNLQKILAMEKELHEELSLKPIPHTRLTGLFVEDLRKLANEIPARHGKVFADPAMRNYFSSLPWYRPNPGFKLTQLSKIERENYDFLLQAAKDTTTQFKMEEG